MVMAVVAVVTAVAVVLGVMAVALERQQVLLQLPELQILAAVAAEVLLPQTLQVLTEAVVLLLFAILTVLQPPQQPEVPQ
jgi:hypothetical protein